MFRGGATGHRKTQALFFNSAHTTIKNLKVSSNDQMDVFCTLAAKGKIYNIRLY